MTVSMNLWHLTLSPGEKYPVYVKRDFVITNAALGEELVDESGRSVVKVTHQPVNPDYFSDNDSEFDSDMSDDELPSDLDDDEDAEVEAEAPKSKGAKADKIEVDEDEEDDDDDEDFDSEDEDETPHVEAVICALTAGKIEQASINLTFVEGEIVVFEATGKNEVHLLGNYINQFPSEEDSDDEDDYSDMYESGDDEDEQSYDEEEMEALMAADGRRGASTSKGKITELPEEPVAAAPASNKRKAEDVESPAKLTKAEKKKLKNAEGKAAAAPAPVETKAEKKAKAAAEKPESASAKGVKKTLPSGLIIEDIKVGSGPVAKAGKRLGMRYIGKLENGKQFDANTGGKPFQFVLGKGEVISGWDQGIVGMAVGGERRLTIPSSLAYGSQKIDKIPKNSTLKFDIKLVEIK